MDFAALAPRFAALSQAQTNPNDIIFRSVVAMTQSTMKAQVAIAALTVALATSAAPVLAQDAGAVPPPVVTTQSAPPPASVVPPPVVHTVAITSGGDSASASSVPVDPAASAAAAGEAASRAKAAPVAKVAAKAPAASAKSAPVIAKAPAPAPDPAPVTNPAPLAQSAPTTLIPPLAQPAPPPVQSAPPPAAVQSSGSMEVNGWWIGLGLAAAAAALALIAYLARRRPAAEYVERTEARPVAAPQAAPDLAPVVPVAPVVAGQGGAMGRHEAAALSGPTPDNPFLTRRARVSRARFYDRRERLAAEEGRPMPFVSQRADDAPQMTKVAASPRRASLTSGWSAGFRPALGES